MQLSRRFLTVARKTKGALVSGLAASESHAAQALSYTQLRVLQEICDHPGSNQRSLMPRVCVDAPAMSRTVRELVDAGLVQKVPADDRRQDALVITDAGRAAVRPLLDVQDALDATLAPALSDGEWATLHAILDRLEGALDAAGGDSTSCQVELPLPRRRQAGSLSAPSRRRRARTGE